MKTCEVAASVHEHPVAEGGDHLRGKHQGDIQAGVHRDDVLPCGIAVETTTDALCSDKLNTYDSLHLQVPICIRATIRPLWTLKRMATI